MNWQYEIETSFCSVLTILNFDSTDNRLNWLAPHTQRQSLKNAIITSQGYNILIGLYHILTTCVDYGQVTVLKNTCPFIKRTEVAIAQLLLSMYTTSQHKPHRKLHIPNGLITNFCNYFTFFDDSEIIIARREVLPYNVCCCEVINVKRCINTWNSSAK